MEVKIVLIFCSACKNIMIQKEKIKNIGIYMCRNCGSIKKLKTKALEIKENVRYLAPPVPIGI